MYKLTFRKSLFVIVVIIANHAVFGQDERQLYGDYTFTNGSNISVLKVPLGLAFFNFETGRFGVLHKDPVKPMTYFAGPGALGEKPKEIEIEFYEPGKRKGSLMYRDLTTNATHHATKNTPFREEETNISYEKIGLRSTISYPHTKGPWPAIVLLHGGGPGLRSDLKVWVNMYNRLGYVCLVYDKRDKGKRESVGPDWETFEDLANDAIAAVRHLEAKKNVVTSRIGIAAFSQGGWVAEIAAAKYRNISFLILLSCPMMSPAERDSISSVMRLRTDGFSDSDVSEAQEFTRAFNTAAKGEIPWEQYDSKLKVSKDKKWFPYVEYVTSSDAIDSIYYRSRYGRFYEPANDLQKISIPVLALFGENDKTVPPIENSKKAYKYLGSNRHSFVFVLPTANHGLVESKTGSDKELIDLNTYSKQYFDLIRIWLNSLK